MTMSKDLNAANFRLKAEIDELEHDIFVLVLRLMGEDKNTHSPETLAVLEKWEPAVCAKLEHT